MKKYSLLPLLLLPFISTVFAQTPPSHPKYEIHYMVDAVETDEVLVSFKNAHSQRDFSLVNVTINNKTSDYIYFYGTEAKFKYAHGEYSPKGSLVSRIDMSIDPKGTDSKTLKVTGDNRFHVQTLTLELSGFYKVSSKGKSVAAPDFQLPASKNSFSAGDCECTLEKTKQETKETWAQFVCKNMGDEVYIVDPSKLSVKLRDGQEFANSNKKNKGGILMPGEEIKFTATFNIPGKIADMQFSVLNINWNDTFIATTKTPMKVGSVEFKYDEGVTTLKNK